ncbi:uncharacterized protein EV420DRAFT_1640418 [Desarmillaria tabescens]|uniref:F-box domain-containing protein n=1 Tax=Armillaria tabescens TaxID=1929756 RepID=A0AA39N8C7_ARMTA|nr:uncharacterized protein EV420DRAFT_1640418 [Desarmillaria tabescens]KAK0460911.1 hypothetical protein EV420DRAFT_1640418 [Desarmillaria tabescens]
MHRSGHRHRHDLPYQSRTQTRSHPQQKIFPILSLPMELFLEIIAYAASPVFPDARNVGIVKPSYSTAVALARVSYLMYQHTMPHLLHTVVLNSTSDVTLFARSVRHQDRRRVPRRLALSYPLLVRRFWCSESYEAIIDRDDGIDYSSLYRVISRAKSIGMPFYGMHLLYNGLASDGARPVEDWKCRRVTFEGNFVRWKPITSSYEGATFLRSITHLSMWVPYHDLSSVSPQEYPVAEWVKDIPFHMMPNLRRFSFPLLVDRRRYEGDVLGYPTLLVYCAPQGQAFNPVTFRDWATSPRFWTYGWQTKLQKMPQILHSDRSDWTVGYVLDETERVWKEVDKMLEAGR